jgi:hypothetical protein
LTNFAAETVKPKRQAATVLSLACCFLQVSCDGGPWKVSSVVQMCKAQASAVHRMNDFFPNDIHLAAAAAAAVSEY